jgi:hypothetical protein
MYFEFNIRLCGDVRQGDEFIVFILDVYSNANGVFSTYVLKGHSI